MTPVTREDLEALGYSVPPEGGVVMRGRKNWRLP